jgi:hypothetical protein
VHHNLDRQVYKVRNYKLVIGEKFDTDTFSVLRLHSQEEEHGREVNVPGKKIDKQKTSD